MKLSELYFLRYILKNNHIAFFISQLNKNVMSTVTKLQNELILDEYSLLAHTYTINDETTIWATIVTNSIFPNKKTVTID